MFLVPQDNKSAAIHYERKVNKKLVVFFKPLLKYYTRNNKLTFKLASLKYQKIPSYDQLKLKAQRYSIQLKENIPMEHLNKMCPMLQFSIFCCRGSFQNHCSRSTSEYLSPNSAVNAEFVVPWRYSVIKFLKHTLSFYFSRQYFVKYY